MRSFRENRPARSLKLFLELAEPIGLGRNSRGRAKTLFRKRREKRCSGSRLSGDIGDDIRYEIMTDGHETQT